MMRSRLLRDPGSSAAGCKTGSRLDRRRPPGAFTLIEAVVASLIFAGVLYSLYGLLFKGTRLGQQELEIFGLQAEGQRSLVRLLKELQEGMEVVLPQPGGTLPYAVVRDKLNRMAVFHLVPGREPRMYELNLSVRSPQSNSTEVLVKGVARLTFSSLSDGAIRVHLTLGTGARRYSFYSSIRLRNRAAVGG
ncbi:MAG: hypothetical protein HY815_10945 [Candidatus Riflebacteria bacterium]|nr:hypothetical protein [Candidatus Riflebacteria bacterium]